MGERRHVPDCRIPCCRAQESRGGECLVMERSHPGHMAVAEGMIARLFGADDNRRDRARLHFPRRGLLFRGSGEGEQGVEGASLHTCRRIGCETTGASRLVVVSQSFWSWFLSKTCFKGPFWGVVNIAWWLKRGDKARSLLAAGRSAPAHSIWNRVAAQFIAPVLRIHLG